MAEKGKESQVTGEQEQKEISFEEQRDQLVAAFSVRLTKVRKDLSDLTMLDNVTEQQLRDLQEEIARLLEKTDERSLKAKKTRIVNILEPLEESIAKERNIFPQTLLQTLKELKKFGRISRDDLRVLEEQKKTRGKGEKIEDAQVKLDFQKLPTRPRKERATQEGELITAQNTAPGPDAQSKSEPSFSREERAVEEKIPETIALRDFVYRKGDTVWYKSKKKGKWKQYVISDLSKKDSRVQLSPLAGQKGPEFSVDAASPETLILPEHATVPLASEELKEKDKREEEPATSAKTEEITPPRPLLPEAEKKYPHLERIQEFEYLDGRYKGPVDKKGRPHGEGIFENATLLYKGTFKHGMRHGAGEIVHKDEIDPIDPTEIVEFEKDKKVSSHRYIRFQKGTYKGFLDMAGKPHGLGIFEDDAVVYTGKFFHGTPDGVGNLKNKKTGEENGVVFKGGRFVEIKTPQEEVVSPSSPAPVETIPSKTAPPEEKEPALLSRESLIERIESYVFSNLIFTYKGKQVSLTAINNHDFLKEEIWQIELSDGTMIGGDPDAIVPTEDLEDIVKSIEAAHPEATARVLMMKEIEQEMKREGSISVRFLDPSDDAWTSFDFKKFKKDRGWEKIYEIYDRALLTEGQQAALQSIFLSPARHGYRYDTSIGHHIDIQLTNRLWPAIFLKNLQDFQHAFGDTYLPAISADLTLKKSAAPSVPPESTSSPDAPVTQSNVSAKKTPTLTGIQRIKPEDMVPPLPVSPDVSKTVPDLPIAEPTAEAGVSAAREIHDIEPNLPTVTSEDILPRPPVGPETPPSISPPVSPEDEEKKKENIDKIKSEEIEAALDKYGISDRARLALPLEWDDTVETNIDESIAHIAAEIKDIDKDLLVNGSFLDPGIVICGGNKISIRYGIREIFLYIQHNNWRADLHRFLDDLQKFATSPAPEQLPPHAPKPATKEFDDKLTAEELAAISEALAASSARSAKPAEVDYFAGDPFADGDVLEEKREIKEIPWSSTATYYGKVNKQDKADGDGKITWNDGSWCEGTFKDGDFLKGTGVIKELDGSGEYTGELAIDSVWRDIARDGRGIFTHADGKVEDGEWKQGKFHGANEIKFPNGDFIWGTFEEGEYQGGTMRHTYDNGDVYLGDISRYEDWEGNGTLFLKEPEGNYIFGEWDGYSLIRAKKARMTLRDGNIYEGDVNEFRRPEGQGILFAHDGTVLYDGQWQDGLQVSPESEPKAEKSEPQGIAWREIAAIMDKEDVRKILQMFLDDTAPIDTIRGDASLLFDLLSPEEEEKIKDAVGDVASFVKAWKETYADRFVNAIHYHLLAELERQIAHDKDLIQEEADIEGKGAGSMLSKLLSKRAIVSMLTAGGAGSLAAIGIGIATGGMGVVAGAAGGIFGTLGYRIANRFGFGKKQRKAEIERQRGFAAQRAIEKIKEKIKNEADALTDVYFDLAVQGGKEEPQATYIEALNHLRKKAEAEHTPEAGAKTMDYLLAALAERNRIANRSVFEELEEKQKKQGRADQKKSLFNSVKEAIAESSIWQAAKRGKLGELGMNVDASAKDRIAGDVANALVNGLYGSVIGLAAVAGGGGAMNTALKATIRFGYGMITGVIGGQSREIAMSEQKKFQEFAHKAEEQVAFVFDTLAHVPNENESELSEDDLKQWNSVKQTLTRAYLELLSYRSTTVGSNRVVPLDVINKIDAAIVKIDAVFNAKGIAEELNQEYTKSSQHVWEEVTKPLDFTADEHKMAIKKGLQAGLVRGGFGAGIGLAFDAVRSAFVAEAHEVKKESAVPEGKPSASAPAAEKPSTPAAPKEVAEALAPKEESTPVKPAVSVVEEPASRGGIPVEEKTEAPSASPKPSGEKTPASVLPKAGEAKVPSIAPETDTAEPAQPKSALVPEKGGKAITPEESALPASSKFTHPKSETPSETPTPRAGTVGVAEASPVLETRTGVVETYIVPQGGSFLRGAKSLEDSLTDADWARVKNAHPEWAEADEDRLHLLWRMEQAKNEGQWFDTQGQYFTTRIHPGAEMHLYRDTNGYPRIGLGDEGIERLDHVLFKERGAAGTAPDAVEAKADIQQMLETTGIVSKDIPAPEGGTRDVFVFDKNDDSTPDTAIPLPSNVTDAVHKPDGTFEITRNDGKKETFDTLDKFRQKMGQEVDVIRKSASARSSSGGAEGGGTGGAERYPDNVHSTANALLTSPNILPVASQGIDLNSLDTKRFVLQFLDGRLEEGERYTDFSRREKAEIESELRQVLFIKQAALSVVALEATSDSQISAVSSPMEKTPILSEGIEKTATLHVNLEPVPTKENPIVQKITYNGERIFSVYKNTNEQPNVEIDAKYKPKIVQLSGETQIEIVVNGNKYNGPIKFFNHGKGDKPGGNDPAIVVDFGDREELLYLDEEEAEWKKKLEKTD